MEGEERIFGCFDERCPRLLVVDDEQFWSERLGRHLERSGWPIHTIDADGRAHETIETWAPDLIVVEPSTPTLDGLAEVRRWRALGFCGAIIACSDLDSPLDVVLALDAGADDLVSRSADVAVLLAKIRRARQRQEQLERREPTPSAPSAIALRDAQNADAWPVERCLLTRIEELLLVELVKTVGETVSAEDLVQAGWGRRSHHPGVLHDAISSLREKLGARGWVIQNVRGVGYRLCCAISPPLDSSLRSA